MRSMAAGSDAGNQLKDGRMLGVDRQQLGARFAHRLHEDPAGADQALLVGERHPSALRYGRERRAQTCGTGDPGHHAVCGPCGGLVQRCRTRCRFDTRARQELLQIPDVSLVGEHGEPRAMAYRNARKHLRIGVCSDRHDLEKMGIAPDNVQRALPDGAGGAENRYASHAGFRGRLARRYLRLSMRQARAHGQRHPSHDPSSKARAGEYMLIAAAASPAAATRGEQAIDAIHHASVPW